MLRTRKKSKALTYTQLLYGTMPSLPVPLSGSVFSSTPQPACFWICAAAMPSVEGKPEMEREVIPHRLPHMYLAAISCTVVHLSGVARSTDDGSSQLPRSVPFWAPFKLTPLSVSFCVRAAQ